MDKQKTLGMRILQKILGIMMICSFLFLLIGELCLPAENVSDETDFHMFNAEWTVATAEGEVKLVAPGQVEAERGEWISATTRLPDNQVDTWVCMRSMQQDMRIYVGDELRKEYSTLDTQLFGKTSTMTYVFVPLYEEDAGEVLKLDFMSDSSYTGYFNEMYEGDYAHIVKHFVGMYAPSAIVAGFMLLIGLAVIIGSAFVRVIYKKKTDLIYLGNMILMTSVWLLVESKIRQFIFPNSTIAMLMGFLLVALLPYPFAAYVNSIQKGRYQKAYITICAWTAVNFIAVVTLQVLNIKDFFETMTSSHILILALILLMAVTFIIDIKKKYVKDYREVAIGFAVLMAAGVFEIALSYIIEAKLNGIALCIGLVGLLFSAGLKSIRDLFNVEKEKQVAIEASESKAKFLANMSHEIRTPINTVIGMNEMILRENTDETIEEYAINIKSASQMLLGLVNDVLDFSKMEAGRLKIIENEYSVSAMLNDVSAGLEIRAKQKNLDVRYGIDDTLPSKLKGDEIRIKQILNNLLSNATKYTEEGTVTFTVKGQNDEMGFSLILAVEDTGIGIKEEDMDKLFDSFQRLELAKNRYIEGTGLGLNITKQMVEMMGGTIEVKSEYGKGSCFTVKLPQQVIDSKPIGNIRKRRKESEDRSMERKALYAPNAKILAVDDTPLNLVVIKGLLKKSGIQVELASGGEECLMKTKTEKYDLILMDHMMPKPDGIETLRMLREDEGNPNRDIPVIVLTANALEGMKEEYLKAGFADYLSKPIEVDVMEETLAKYLVDKV
ncbi:MAG: response regulator [Lachnospiraceae bacterium]|nr:response regulator [Lachnospiraceae bacterium]